MGQLGNTIINGKLIVNGLVSASSINATLLNGKTESQLNVNYANSAGSATNASSLNNKSESALSVSHASTASTATTANTVAVTTAASNSYTLGLLSVSNNKSSIYNTTAITINTSTKTIDAKDYTLNVGTITGTITVNGSVENAAYATCAGYAASAGYANSAGHATSAGSAETSDSATSAERLSNTVSIGSASLPVYFSSTGVPVACGTTLDVSITGNSNYSTSAGYTTNLNVTSTIGTTNYYLIGVSGTSASSEVYTNTGIKFSGNTLIASTFSGNLKGTADSAKAFTSSAGSTNKPIYINSSGAPTQVTSISEDLLPYPKHIQTKHETEDNWYGSSYTIYAKWVADNVVKWVGDGFATAVDTATALCSTSYSKLSVGSASGPVYFSEGVPVSCSTTLDVNISGTASFASAIGTSSANYNFTEISNFMQNTDDTLGEIISGACVVAKARYANAADTADYDDEGRLFSTTYQTILTAGNGISISADGVISVTFADGDEEVY